MPPFAQSQPVGPVEVQSPHWAWRTVGGRRDPKTNTVAGMVPSPHYWAAGVPPEREPSFTELIGATIDRLADGEPEGVTTIGRFDVEYEGGLPVRMRWNGQ